MLDCLQGMSITCLCNRKVQPTTKYLKWVHHALIDFRDTEHGRFMFRVCRIYPSIATSRKLLCKYMRMFKKRTTMAILFGHFDEIFHAHS